jgi:hypothetical protein
MSSNCCNTYRLCMFTQSKRLSLISWRLKRPAENALNTTNPDDSHRPRAEVLLTAASSIRQLNCRVVQANTERSVNLQACITGEWGGNRLLIKARKLWFSSSLSSPFSLFTTSPTLRCCVGCFKWSVSHTITVIWEHVRLVTCALARSLSSWLTFVHFRRVCWDARRERFFTE